MAEAMFIRSTKRFEEMADGFFGSSGGKTSVAGAVKETLYKEASLRQLFSLSLSPSPFRHHLSQFSHIYPSSLKRITIAVAITTTLPAEIQPLIREQLDGQRRSRHRRLLSFVVYPDSALRLRLTPAM